MCGAQLAVRNRQLQPGITKLRIWNLTRFHPFWALIEMTMGIVAARHVMLDTEEDKKKKPTLPGKKCAVLQVLSTR